MRVDGVRVGGGVLYNELEGDDGEVWEYRKKSYGREVRLGLGIKEYKWVGGGVGYVDKWVWKMEGEVGMWGYV